MIRLLGCGSSHRSRGSGGWTLIEPVQRLLCTLRPDLVAHGDSPAGGADEVIDHEAAVYFSSLLEYPLAAPPPDQIRRYPMRRDLDGQGGRAFLNRNERMGEDFKPHVAAAFVVGKVGQRVGTNGNYLSNGSQSMVQWLREHHVPTVIYRENGVEPCRSLEEALVWLRTLFYQLGREPALRAPGIALVALSEGRTTQEEVLASLRCARETSRFAPWLEAIEGAARAGETR